MQGRAPVADMSIRSAEVQGLIYRVDYEWRKAWVVTLLVVAAPVYLLVGLLGWDSGWQAVTALLAAVVLSCAVASMFRGSRYYDRQRDAIYERYQEVLHRS